MIVATIVFYFAIRSAGAHLSAPVAPVGQLAFSGGGGGEHVDNLLHVLVTLLVIIAAARALGRLCIRFGQPPVVGEIVAGILLGPSLLGRFAPSVAAFVLPPALAPVLQVIAQLGVILFMFLVGIELDPARLRRRGHATIAISHASIVAPFLLGAVLTLLSAALAVRSLRRYPPPPAEAAAVETGPAH